MKIKTPDEHYLEKVRLLTEKDAEHLLSRMRKKLRQRAEDKRLITIEAMAIQLELEDEQLNEWRTKMAEIREKDKFRFFKQGHENTKASNAAQADF